MNAPSSALAMRLAEIRGRIAAAAGRSDRSPDEVTLVGAIKSVPLALVRDAVAAGLRDLGENRVQEASQAVQQLGRDAARWHMIGHLQRNKLNRALTLFDRFHAIDGEPLARVLSERAEAQGLRVPVLIEVNVAGEATKFGVPPERVSELAERVAGMKGLALDGLMVIGPDEGPEAARRWFAAARELRDTVQRSVGLALPHLSMGMSGDFEVAVEEGSTLVRVGTALFGPRVA